MILVADAGVDEIALVCGFHFRSLGLWGHDCIASPYVVIARPSEIVPQGASTFRAVLLEEFDTHEHG